MLLSSKIKFSLLLLLTVLYELLQMLSWISKLGCCIVRLECRGKKPRKHLKQR